MSSIIARGMWSRKCSMLTLIMPRPGLPVAEDEHAYHKWLHSTFAVPRPSHLPMIPWLQLAMHTTCET